MLLLPLLFHIYVVVLFFHHSWFESCFYTEVGASKWNRQYSWWDNCTSMVLLSWEWVSANWWSPVSSWRKLWNRTAFREPRFPQMLKVPFVSSETKNDSEVRWLLDTCSACRFCPKALGPFPNITVFRMTNYEATCWFFFNTKQVFLCTFSSLSEINNEVLAYFLDGVFLLHVV